MQAAVSPFGNDISVDAPRCQQRLSSRRREVDSDLGMSQGTSPRLELFCESEAAATCRLKQPDLGPGSYKALEDSTCKARSECLKP